MVQQVTYGKGIALSTFNTLCKYIVVSQPIPWDKYSKKITKQPLKVLYCQSMERSYLDQIADANHEKYSNIVALGGGVACDTGKYLAWKWKKPLILVPSIISVDAFLSKEVGVRVESSVSYMGTVEAKQVIIDYDLIRSAPNYLNYAGVGDVISCASALGDWKIGRDEFNNEFNQEIFDDTQQLVNTMIAAADDIHTLSEKGIKDMVEFLREECILCERWGNARPEEGGEHFLAYALEKVKPRQYLHGALIGLNVLIVLRLQGSDAVFSVEQVKNFLDKVGVTYSPNALDIDPEDFRSALEYVQEYIASNKLFNGLWSRKKPFKNASIDEILEWIYSF